MKKILGFGALFLIVPILLSGCSSTPISDYDKVSLIEYQECLALLGAQKVASFSKHDYDVFGATIDDFKYSVLKNCKEFRPAKEGVPLPVK